jgi:hypothetical protein
VNASQDPTPARQQAPDGDAAGDRHWPVVGDPVFGPYDEVAGAAYRPDGSGWPGDLRPRRRPWRRTVAVCSLVVLVLAAAGVPLGLLWAWLSPTVPVIETSGSDVVVNDPSPEQFVAADGWFTLLGFGFGVLVALTVWLLLRRHRGPWLLLATVLGALGAAPVAWQVGRQLGLDGYERWRAAAAAGDTFSRPPDLHAHAALLVPAFAAVIVCTLLAGWSNDPDLEVPGARPGYGHNHPDAAHPDAAYPGPDQHGPDQHGPDQHGPDQLSWGSPAGPDPTTAPAPPVSGPAAPPHG